MKPKAKLWLAWGALALAVAGCHRRPQTPEAAFLALEKAVVVDDARAFYEALDADTRWSIESAYRDQQTERTVIDAKYPEAEAQAALAHLAAAAEPDAARYFARLDRDRREVAGYRKRLGAVSGPVLIKPAPNGEVYVARQDGMPFRFHQDRDGSWGFAELGAEWTLEKERAVHALKTVKENAALYQKAEAH